MVLENALSEKKSALIALLTSLLFNVLITLFSGSYGLVFGQDEFGYIEKAYSLAGVPIGDYTKYSFGYGVLLIPLAFIHSSLSSLEVWQYYIIAINSMAYAMFISYIVRWRCFFSCELLRGRCVGSCKCQVSARSLLILLIAMPTLSLSGSSAMATSVLVALSTATLFHMAKRFVDGSVFDLIVAATLLFASVLVHPTAILLVGICGIYFISSLIRCRRWYFSKASSFCLLTLTALIGWKTQSIVSGKLAEVSGFSAGADSYSVSFSDIFYAPLSWRFYLMVGTLMAALYLVSGGSLFLFWRNVFKQVVSAPVAGGRRRSIQLISSIGHPAAGVLLGSLFAGPIFTAAILYRTQRPRADDWLYLRYALPAFALVVALAVTNSEVGKVRRNPWVFPLVGLVLALGMDLAVPGPQTALFVGNFSEFALFHLLGWRIGIGFGILVIVSGFLLTFQSGKVLTISFLFVLSFVGISEYRRVAAQGHNADSPLTDVIDSATRAGDCVVLDGNVPEAAYDSGPEELSLDAFRSERHRYLYFDLDHLAQVVGPSYEGCADLRLSYDMTSEGTLVARESYGGLGLFVRDDDAMTSLTGEWNVDESITGVQYLHEGDPDACLRAGCFAFAAESRWLQRVNGDTVSHGPYATLESGHWHLRIRFSEIPNDRDAVNALLTWLKDGDRVDLPISLDKTSWVDPRTIDFMFELTARVHMFEVVTVERSNDQLLSVEELMVRKEFSHAD